LSADQVGYQRRETIVWALEPVVLDRHVLVFDVTSFAEAFAERRHIACVDIGRPCPEKRDHRQRRLLCTRPKRPHNRCAAEKRNELSSLHVPSARTTLCATL